MIPLTSLGLTPGMAQPGASSTAPEQPGLFDLVLSLQQQGPGTGLLQEARSTDAPVAFSLSASPLAQGAPCQTSALPMVVGRVLSALAKSAPGKGDAPADEEGAPAATISGFNELTPVAALASNNITPEVAKITPDVPAVVPYVARAMTAAFTKPVTPVDGRTERDREALSENASEVATTPPMSQIWALLSAARTGESKGDGKNDTVDGASSDRDPPPAGPLAFLSGKGAKATPDLTNLPVNDGRQSKDVRKSIDSVLDALPTPINPGRDQASNAQQPAPVRSEHAGLAQPQSVSDVDTKQLDLLMRDISELTSTAGKAAFHLSSEHLGRLQVHLETTEVGVSVAIRTDNERGHVAVSQAQKQLQDDLHANGLKVAETSVALGQNGAEQQRSDRNAPVRIAPKIEAAIERPSDAEENRTDRPDGRFA